VGDARNVVEVFGYDEADETLAAGSGFHLGHGLVLTVRLGSRLRVRFPGSDQRHEGVVVWEATDVDAILVEVRLPDTVVGHQPLSWGVLAAAPQSMGCEIIAFSGSLRRGHPRHTIRLEGNIVASVADPQPRRLTIRPTTVMSEWPDGLYAELPGAPVWSGDALVAIVVGSSGESELDWLLAAVPVTAFAEDQRFTALVSAAAGASPTMRTLDGPASAAANYDVFLSYANRDISLARLLDTHLSRGGLRVYFAERLLGDTEQVSESLSDAILRSHTFVIIVSGQFDKNSWPEWEVATARRRADLQIVPVLLGDIAPPSLLADYPPIRLPHPTDKEEVAQAAAQTVALVNVARHSSDDASLVSTVAGPSHDDEKRGVGGIGIWGYRDRPATRDGLQQRMHVREPTPALLKRVPIHLYVFDVLHLGERSTVKQPYQQRRDLLDSLGLNDDLVRTPPYWASDDGADLMAAAADQGLEGVVSKRLDSPYQPGCAPAYGSRRRATPPLRSSSADGRRVPGAAPA
jgi:hypothetical protein